MHDLQTVPFVWIYQHPGVTIFTNRTRYNGSGKRTSREVGCRWKTVQSRISLVDGVPCTLYATRLNKDDLQIPPYPLFPCRINPVC